MQYLLSLRFGLVSLRLLNKKKIPLKLLNARITKKTFDKWRRVKKFSNSVFQNISIAYPQNEETFNYLKKLNVSQSKKNRES